LYWRRDGQPLWSDPDLLADPWAEDREWSTPDGADRALLIALAGDLGLPESQVRAAYEDPLTRLAASVRRPAGDPVSTADDIAPQEDSEERRSELLAGLDEQVTRPAAHLLPLHRGEDGSGWESADWQLRRGRIVLTEGRSPAGLRLPLAAVSWKPAPHPTEADPLSATAELDTQRSGTAAVVPADGVPTTAMVAEIRDGLLYLFLPPLESLDDFVDLIARVEAAATCPLVIEGYGPPPDPRLEAMSVTPDPGVIEVNVTPTGSFAEQSRQLEVLYEEARKARLTTESFDTDGTHTGTGGGSHITLGGRTPATSPLLRRPDLLVSLLTYWQHHPALSYLFSGRFVGTTSQAPRVDEGREEALYELEIAFAEIERLTTSPGPDRAADAAPWHVDRALRHLLTDITGNTHRAEFCIDKLYSPDSARGRLGLLELRGFEMPPHFQMAMVQSLLVRALVAKFWEQPLRAPLIRHGANLHGRYLLPHFIIHDIAQVAADLRAHGIAFETSWLDPFTEFRFPRIGTAVFDGIEVELRGAIEPWRVLGEEATAGGTARYVDSSIERVQVRVIGADRSRYVITCNGQPIPLLSTANPDVQVAGVRYRAWQPPSALHPSITVDDPLRFELIDTANALSRGGCTYHVSHPGGRAYDDPPVNAVAAEARRGRRFDATGYTTGRVDLSDLREKQARMSTDAVAPGILDLRRARTVGRR
jgi:uncharacterized protein (DUF2126 family)